MTNPDTYFFVYFIVCKNRKTQKETLYIGYTKNILNRWREHTNGIGAKYTRNNPPQFLLSYARFEDSSEARRKEYEYKQLRKEKKWEFAIQLQRSPQNF